MSSRDYESIARVFASERARLEASERYGSDVNAGAMMEHAKLAGKVADYMAEDNPRFDRSRFMRASGIGL